MLICFVLILTGSALEIGLRVASVIEKRRARAQMGIAQDAPEDLWATYDPDVGFRPTPGFGDSNANGLRDHPIGPKDGRFRVLVLGDSIAVYGDNVDDTFVGYLRAELLRNPAFQRTDVINGGVTAYTNYQELLFLKKYGLKFQPDLVGVEFCLNDLHKFLHAFEVENGRLVPAKYFSSDAKPRNVTRATRSWPVRLVKESYLLAWTRYNLRLATDTLLWKVRGGLSFDYTPDISNAWKDEPWKEIESQLREMVDLGREHHFGVFVVSFPVAVQYRTDYLARDRGYVLKPQRKLREICARLGIPFYDLYPDLGASMLLDDGIHLAKAGRQAAGRRIAAFLVESKLLPVADVLVERAAPNHR